MLCSPNIFLSNQKLSKNLQSLARAFLCQQTRFFFARTIRDSETDGRLDFIPTKSKLKRKYELNFGVSLFTVAIIQNQADIECI